MKFGVVIFPGSNCDRDIVEILRDEFGREVIELWHKDEDISIFTPEDCIVLPGGFSFGDYLRCGAIAGFSPMMKSVIQFAGAGGKVLGICNGFQVLCESGLLPGVLLRNEHQQFICKNVYLKPENGNPMPLKIPIAHGEGRFYAPKAMIDEIEACGQVLFRYSSEDGTVDVKFNPNGAVNNIAGISNKQGNVVGMMPHPERASSRALGNIDGRSVFNALYDITAVN